MRISSREAEEGTVTDRAVTDRAVTERTGPDGSASAVVDSVAVPLASLGQLGVVVIGRNEGDRLIRGLKSIIAQVRPQPCPQASPQTASAPSPTELLPAAPLPIVYVDSGSSDGSVAAAQQLGVQVLSLDLSQPFTMARGRNAGFDYLRQRFPDLAYVQFMDGDCELVAGWLAQALAVLQSDASLAVVCGRRRERFPEASPYNRLADMEWDTPVGEAAACGGDALMRVAAIAQAKGYNPRLICGEEPELCLRLRRQGWKIQRIEAEMTLHDAAMLRFSQWWMRSVRGGWFVAEGAALYGAAPEGYLLKERRSGWLWGLIIPIVSLGLAWPSRGLSLGLLLGYGLLAGRVYGDRRRRGDPARQAALYAGFCTLSKGPQMLGQLKYHWQQWRGQTAQIIEYK